MTYEVAGASDFGYDLKDPHLYASNPQLDPGHAEQLVLGLTDRERRKLAGSAFDAYFTSKGFDGVTYVCNIADALPKTTQADLANHSVPIAAYGGRMFGTALGPHPRWAVNVVSAQPLPSEANFIAVLANHLDSSQPQRLDQEDHAGENNFIWPFIGDPKFVARYGDRTLPDGQPYNSKSLMRQVMRDIGEEENLAPGIEVIYTPGESQQSYYARVRAAIRDESARHGVKLWLKLDNTASGLKTARYTPEDLLQPDADAQINRDLDAMFVQPDTGVAELESVVIEHHIEHHANSQYGDYNLRGSITPYGQFIPVFAGRSVNHPELGEYYGMFGARLDSPEQLANIGLDYETMLRSVRTAEKLARYMYQKGYWGPFSVDFFARQLNPNGKIRFRDFNMREGGTSVGGLITSEAESFWPGAMGVLDVEMGMETVTPLSDDQLETMSARLFQAGILPYSTTFLRHPKLDTATNKTRYTLKLLAPQHGPVTTSALASQSIAQLAQYLNGLGMAGLNFKQLV